MWGSASAFAGEQNAASVACPPQHLPAQPPHPAARMAGFMRLVRVDWEGVRSSRFLVRLGVAPGGEVRGLQQQSQDQQSPNGKSSMRARPRARLAVVD